MHPPRPTWRSTPSTSTGQGSWGGRERRRGDRPTRRWSSVGRGSRRLRTSTPATTRPRPGTTSPTASARRRNCGRDHRRPGARLACSLARPLLGDTQPRVPGLHRSPAPAGRPHKQWDDPKKLGGRRRGGETTAEGAASTPRSEIERRKRDHLQRSDSSASPPAAPAGRPERLVVTVNSADDKLPPQTYTFALEPALRGSLQTDIELAARQAVRHLRQHRRRRRPPLRIGAALSHPRRRPTWQRLHTWVRDAVARLRGHR